MLDALTGLLRTLAEDDDLGIAPDLLADERPGWRSPGEPLLAELLEATTRHWAAPPHVAASLLWKAYSYWASLPVALGWALGRRVPLMTYDRTLVRMGADVELELGLREVPVAVTAADPLAGEPGTVVVADEDELLELVRETVLRDHFGRIIEVLHDRSRVGRRSLWGSVAEALAYPLITHTGSMPEVTALLEGLELDGLVQPLPGPPGLRRRTCCLWVTLPDSDACSTCCLRRPSDGALVTT